MRTAVLASGRGSNLQALIDAWRLGELPVEFVGVGSDRPGVQALERARKAGIPVWTFDAGARGAREESMAQWLDETRAQLLLLAGYMRLLSEAFVRSAGMPILNIHPSLLPDFPGLHAQRQALEAGAKFSGCTVHYVDEGMDTGPVILQRVVPVLAGDNEESLSQRILEAEHLLYPEAVRLVCRNMINKKARG
ncbi:MAG: phosphoribosylglycinamide formyltransferase [Peptococcaceae bacterium]|nr:phosphoribosylglycinamide formyltransferase [Peptococcaceae bacterium]